MTWAWTAKDLPEGRSNSARGERRALTEYDDEGRAGGGGRRGHPDHCDGPTCPLQPGSVQGADAPVPERLPTASSDHDLGVRSPSKSRRLSLAVAAALMATCCAADPELTPPAAVSEIDAALDRPCSPAPEIGLRTDLAPLRVQTLVETDGVPTDVAEIDGSLLVALRDGRVVDATGRVLVDVSDDTSLSGDQGLFSIEPVEDGLLSLRTAADGALELALHPTDLGTSQTLLRVDQPDERHNGGGLAVDRATGQVFVGVGDGGGQGGWFLGDDPAFGTVLRGEVRHGRLMPVGAATDLVWATGLRNPHRIWIDDADLWIADTGESCREEVSRVGLDEERPDLGWNAREGELPFVTDEQRASVDPVAVWDHLDDRCAVVGGAVGPSWLDGMQVVADHCTGEVFVVTDDGIGELPLELDAVTAVDVVGGELVALLLDGRVVTIDRGDAPSV